MNPNFLDNQLEYTYDNGKWAVNEDRVELVTSPHTDLWQRTYYGFQNDNAPMIQIETDKPYFSFVAKVEFDSGHRFDQAGVVLYLDSDNWIKGSVEYENQDFQRLGSVVTHNGYSDWATQDIAASIQTVWYRLSRRESDYQLEYSLDGKDFKQMRITHLDKGADTIQFGIYACSPEDSSFKATFSELSILPCQWDAHA